MKKTIGYIINIDGEQSDLNRLLQQRSISTLPFGGRYRLVDFALSNMVNSGISHVGVVGSHKYSSLIDHLGTGKEWSLSHKTQDLSILAGSGSVRFNDLVRLNVRDMLNNRPYLDHSDVENVIISAPNLVTAFNYQNAMEIHKRNQADVTLIYKKIRSGHVFTGHDIYLSVDKFKVSEISYTSENAQENVFADMLIIRKETLMQLLSLSERAGEWDLMDVLKDNIDTLKIFGAPHDVYIRSIYNLDTYFSTSMELLNYTTMKALFMGGEPIYTKIKDNHPTQYFDGAQIKESIIASGCQIHGNVTKSILFRDSLIGESSDIRNTILMQKAEVGKNVKLNYVICDKDVSIRDNTVLTGSKEHPVILEKGSTI